MDAITTTVLFQTCILIITLPNDKIISGNLGNIYVLNMANKMS